MKRPRAFSARQKWLPHGNSRLSSSSGQVVYHYSENPDIKLFEPRAGRQIDSRPAGEQLVWAIDAHHSPVYYFPRECPRILLWAIEGSTDSDIERWIGNGGVRMVAYIEARWLQRLETCELFRYSFDRTGFEDIGDHGVHVSPNPVTPVDVRPVGDLHAALSAESVELRVFDSLQPVADAWFSTLHYSGVRLSNATNWVSPV